MLFGRRCNNFNTINGHSLFSGAGQACLPASLGWFPPETPDVNQLASDQEAGIFRPGKETEGLRGGVQKSRRTSKTEV
jgi:hypothetical protein